MCGVLALMENAIMLNRMFRCVLFALAIFTGGLPDLALTQTVLGEEIVTIRATYRLDISSQTGFLDISATIKDGYHIYALDQAKPFLATEISLDPTADVQIAGDITPAREPIVLRHPSVEVELREHEGAITWSVPFRVQPPANLGGLRITGVVTAQACTDSGCLAPKSYSFQAIPGSALSTAAASQSTVDGGREPSSASAKSDSLDGSSPVNSPPILDLDRLVLAQNTNRELSLWSILPFALVAGLILNFMPCVLPVIGLKIMSFARQAGGSRTRILTLNLWYTAGMLAVFAVLASLAVFLRMGWGEPFSNLGFNLVTASVVFAFGLSLLGVWEIPALGLNQDSVAGRIAQREGALGAFGKGVLTTVLATPCSGPFLGSVLTWAVRQPPGLTYLVFGFVGLGMASPYLLAAVFPGLVQMLPRPGQWMVIVKQAMGFAMLATVAYFLTFIPTPYVVPTIVFLLGMGMGLWRIGMTPMTATLDNRLASGIQGMAFSAAVGYLAFGWLVGVMDQRFRYSVDREIAARQSAIADAPNVIDRPMREGAIAWQPYSEASLRLALEAGRTVFVDFTADWCLTCKANEALAIEQPQTRKLIEDHRVVVLKADKTRPAPEVDDLLQKLGNQASAIPFYAIFPARDPNHPILLDGVITSPAPIIHALIAAVNDDPAPSDFSTARANSSAPQY